jgi:hypothetical protein
MSIDALWLFFFVLIFFIFFLRIAETQGPNRALLILTVANCRPDALETYAYCYSTDSSAGYFLLRLLL